MTQPTPTILVVQLSEAFCHFWDDLARDLQAAHRTVPEMVGETLPPDTAAVILAAGGAENEARDWLSTLNVPDDIPLFVAGSDDNRRTAARIVSLGARDYFALPDDVELLRSAVAAAVARRRECIEHAARVDQRVKFDAFAEIVGESFAMKELLKRATRLLPHARATVLITGETGTGKELLAQAIHAGGPRRNAPFVAVNCSALPAQLVESELFGHERGAFTNAHTAKPGLFEVADGGTLFLDEIGEFPLELQAKLLRVLDAKEVRRVGGTKNIPVNVRVIAATNVDLGNAVEEGKFRDDLFYRLGVITLALPPLRERGQDVVPIAKALLERVAAEHEITAPELSPELHRVLLESPWPGNVREVKNALERALLLSTDGELCVEELHAGRPRFNGPLPFPASLDEIVQAAAQAMLDRCGGNRSESARQLGITRKRLKRILERCDSGRSDEHEADTEPLVGEAA